MAKQVGLVKFVGRIGDTVGQATRGGWILRGYTKPTNPQSAAQVFDRQIISQLSKYWNALGSAKQALWETWAETITAKNPATKMSAQFEGYTGYTLYMHCNANLMQTGQNVIDRPPPGYSYDQFTYTGMSSAPAQFAAGSLDVTFSFTFDDETLVYANYGGFKTKGGRKVQGRQDQWCPIKVLKRDQMPGSSSSPITANVTTDLTVDDFPCDYLIQVQFIDQCGQSAGLTEFYTVPMVAA